MVKYQMIVEKASGKGFNYTFFIVHYSYYFCKKITNFYIYVRQLCRQSH